MLWTKQPAKRERPVDRRSTQSTSIRISSFFGSAAHHLHKRYFKFLSGRHVKYSISNRRRSDQIRVGSHQPARWPNLWNIANDPWRSSRSRRTRCRSDFQFNWNILKILIFIPCPCSPKRIVRYTCRAASQPLSSPAGNATHPFESLFLSLSLLQQTEYIFQVV